jgi:hypothetical protein
MLVAERRTLDAGCRGGGKGSRPLPPCRGQTKKFSQTARFAAFSKTL